MGISNIIVYVLARLNYVGQTKHYNPYALWSKIKSTPGKRQSKQGKQLKHRHCNAHFHKLCPFKAPLFKFLSQKTVKPKNGEICPKISRILTFLGSQIFKPPFWEEWVVVVVVRQTFKKRRQYGPSCNIENTSKLYVTMFCCMSRRLVVRRHV